MKQLKYQASYTYVVRTAAGSVHLVPIKRIAFARRDVSRQLTALHNSGHITQVEREVIYEQAEAVIMNQVFQQAYGFEAKPDKLFENFVIETFLPYSEANKKSFRCDV